MSVTPIDPIDIEIQRAVPRNFTVGILDGGFFFLGMSFASVVTIMPLFVSQLTDNPFLIGLIPAIPTMGWLIPQLLTAQYVERLARKKPYVMAMTLNERWPFLGMAVLAFFVQSLAASVALATFFLLHTMRCFSAGFTATAWQDMVGKVIPGRRLGAYFGLQQGFGGLLGAGGAIVAGLLIDRVPYSQNFATSFLIAFIMVMVSLVFLGLTREPARAPATSRPRGREFWASLPAIVQSNRPYRNFLLYRVMFLFGGMGVAFFTVHVVNDLGMSAAQAGEMTFVMMLAQTITYPSAGWLGDRFGHRRVMEIAALSGVAMALMAWLAPSATWFFGVYALFGVSSAAAIVSNLSGVFDFCTVEERPTYIGLTASLVGIPSILAPIVGASIVSASGSYDLLFAITAGCCAVAFVIVHWGVHDLKRGPIDFSAINQPGVIDDGETPTMI